MLASESNVILKTVFLSGILLGGAASCFSVSLGVGVSFLFGAYAGTPGVIPIPPEYIVGAFGILTLVLVGLAYWAASLALILKKDATKEAEA